MLKFDVLTEENAPADAKPIMQAVRQKFGFLPNLIGVFAHSPVAAKAYTTLVGLTGETSFTPIEQHILAITISRVNGCGYCASAHTMLLKKVGADADTVGAVAEGTPLSDAKLEALRTFVTKMVEKRGRLDHDADIQPFLDAGYRQEQVLEVLIPIAMKTLGNYANHLAKTPLDPQFGGPPV